MVVNPESYPLFYVTSRKNWVKSLFSMDAISIFKLGIDKMATMKNSGVQALSLFNDMIVPIKITVIVLSTLIIFFQDIYVIGSDALASDYFNYVLIIPLLSLYLVYRKRQVLSALLPHIDDEGRGYLNYILGASGLAVSLIVYLYGAYTSFPLDYHLIALQIYLLSGILLLFNRQVLKIVAFPILLISTSSAFSGRNWNRVLAGYVPEQHIFFVYYLALARTTCHIDYCF